MSTGETAGTATPIPDLEAKYAALLEDLRGVVGSQRGWVPNLANTAAVLFATLNGWAASETDGKEAYSNWAGFYMIDEAEQMCTLGPFQGEAARVHIKFGKGVCGTTAAARATTVVPNVHEFPGHIACDCASESEIVVPVFDGDGDGARLVAIIDIDSPVLGRFGDADKAGLEAVAAFLSTACDWPNSV